MIVSTSKTQHDWNFGTLQQKIDPSTWDHICRHITDQLLVPIPIIGPYFLLIILLAGAMAAPKKIPLIMIFLAGFSSGPIIFTNLYFEHNYYWCANGIWLLLSVGIAIVGIQECRATFIKPEILAIAVTLTICTSGFIVWSKRFQPILQAIPSRQQFEDSWGIVVRMSVPTNNTILILGNDWNPAALYYAERKGIMLPATNPTPLASLQKCIAALSENESIAAVVINPNLLNIQNNEGFLNLFKYLSISEKGTQTPFGILFLKLISKSNHD